MKRIHRIYSSVPNPMSRRLFSTHGQAIEGRKKTTVRTIKRLYKKGEPITMVTAVDYPTGYHVNEVGFDILLVGDSVGMVTLGMESTIPVTLDHILHHTKAVVKGAPQPFIVADLPFGACEGDPYDTLKNAQRLLKEGGADGVKIEGGRKRAPTIRMLVDAGIPVMSHIGLCPQMVNTIGGYISQGKTATQAKRLMDDSLMVQDAGAFACVIECVPTTIAGAITQLLHIPTIGIGAGSETSGQVLVLNDLVGFTSLPHQEQRIPKFCKRYGTIGQEIHRSLKAYHDEVKSKQYPSEEYSPYKISPDEQKKLDELMKQYISPSSTSKG